MTIVLKILDMSLLKFGLVLKQEMIGRSGAMKMVLGIEVFLRMLVIDGTQLINYLMHDCPIKIF